MAKPKGSDRENVIQYLHVEERGDDHRGEKVHNLIAEDLHKVTTYEYVSCSCKVSL